MIKLAICDNDPTFLEQVQRLTRSYLNQIGMLFSIDIFSHGESLCSDIQNGFVYDIVFLDIELGDMNGINVGGRLREHSQGEKPILIYISVHDNRAKELFHLNVHRFLSKPLDPLSFHEALHSAIAMFPKEKGKIFSFKDCSTGLTQLNIDEILYFGVTRNHRIDIITNKRGYRFYGKLIDVQSQLETDGFLRIHQSYLINYNYIKAITYKEITMGNQITLPISGPRRKQIRKEYMEIKRKPYL